MKKMNRKGFTIVELVIVIAVIAILAGVMIPTFSSIVEKANKSAALQEAGQILKEVMIDNNGDINFNKGEGTTAYDLYIIAKGYEFTVLNGQISEGTKIEDARTAPTDTNYIQYTKKDSTGTITGAYIYKTTT